MIDRVHHDARTLYEALRDPQYAALAAKLRDALDIDSETWRFRESGAEMSIWPPITREIDLEDEMRRYPDLAAVLDGLDGDGYHSGASWWAMLMEAARLLGEESTP